MNPADIAEFIEELGGDSRCVIVFRLLRKEQAAEVFSYLEHDLQQQIVTAITDKELRQIIDELFLDDAVDFLEEMPASIVKRVIKNTDSDTRKQINQLLMYPEDSAGSLMTIEYMEVDSEWTVKKGLEQVRKECEDKESIASLFVTDEQRHLQGKISIRDLLAGKDEQLIAELMDDDIISVKTHDDQADVAEIFKKYDMISLPVVDTENRLVGIITIDDVVDVIVEESTEDIYKMAAMEPIDESYSDTGVFTLARKRIVWLAILMISATFTGLIIEKYQAALSANILLTSFIPMLMDTSGNAGSQASVSVIRALVLSELEFGDIFKVIWKEFRVSIIVGIAIAVLNFGRIMLMHGEPMTALVISLTLICSIIAAKFVGCTLPLIAAKLKLDPALMASPMITTIVDAVSLVVYFSIATALLM